MEKNMNRMLAMIVFLVFGLLIYLGFVIDSYKPVVEQNQPGILPKKEVVNDDYELPELSEQEEATTDSLIKDNVHTVEQESERKSVENIREEVIKILNEDTEDDTVTISFNMQWTPSWIEQ